MHIAQDIRHAPDAGRRARGRVGLLRRIYEHRADYFYILPALGDVNLVEVSRGTVRTWHDVTMVDTPPRARSKAYALLRTIMNSAVRDELITASPVQIRGAGVVRRMHEIEPASIPELDAITAEMPARLRLMVLLATWCAMRYGEIAELRRKDIKLRHVNGRWTGVIQVRRGVVDNPELYGDDIIVVEQSGSKTAFRRLIESIPVLGVFSFL